MPVEELAEGVVCQGGGLTAAALRVVLDAPRAQRHVQHRDARGVGHCHVQDVEQGARPRRSNVGAPRQGALRAKRRHEGDSSSA